MALIGILKNKAGKDFFPRTKMDAVDGLNERLGHIEVKDITATTSTSLPNSNAGRLLFTEIKGVMEQGENPSPTNQQEIKNSLVSGIKTHGKNLLDCKGLSESTSRGVTIAPKYDSNGLLEYIVLNGTATERVDKKLGVFNYDAGTKYVASNGTSGSSSTFALYSSVIGTIYSTKTFEATEDGTSDISLTIFKGASLSNVKLYPQLEVGTESTPYEPYTESTITFSQPIELYGLEDVRDTIENGKVKRRFEKVVFDGSDDEMWTLSSTLAGRYAISLTNEGVKPFGKCLCTQGIMGVNNTQVVNECYLSQYSAFVINTNFATLEEWKAHLQANPMTVVYELAEETTEELPLADQIALNGLETFYGITHVEFISEVKPTFSAKYGTTEMGGMTLESLLTARSNDLRLSAVESAVINNI